MKLICNSWKKGYHFLYMVMSDNQMTKYIIYVSIIMQFMLVIPVLIK